MKLTQKTQDWGNSTGIRIPKKVLIATRWQADQEVNIDIRGRSILLTPVDKPKTSEPTLDDLITKITPDNIHDAIDWGKPVGKELW